MGFKIITPTLQKSIQNAFKIQRRFRQFDCAPPQYKIVMCRHGQSEYNKKMTFCGWVDSELSQLGIEQSIDAGRLIRDTGHKFNVAYTSQLSRAHQSLHFILKESNQNKVKIIKNWRLNELHYGDLTGLNIHEMEKRFGSARVWQWRRGFGRLPKPMSSSHPLYKEIRNDPRYSKAPTEDEFPRSETLEKLMLRMIPFWKDVILPDVIAGKKVLIVAHNNTLRGILKHLKRKSDLEMLDLSIPNGKPFIFILDHCFRPLKEGAFEYITRKKSESKESKEKPEDKSDKKVVKAEKKSKKQLELEVKPEKKSDKRVVKAGKKF